MWSLFGGNRLNKLNNHPGNPQYFASVAPATYPGSNVAMSHKRPKRSPATVTTGFDDTQYQAWALHYGFRTQPDVGGALNYAYELYGIPIDNVCGPWMVARHPTMPIGSRPMAFFQNAPLTSIGGLIPGQVIAQPLLDPNGPGSGYDVYS
jgi:hypothetical protein